MPNLLINSVLEVGFDYHKQGKKDLQDLVTVRMPFGKYKGWVLCDLPEPYLVWFKQKGFPKSRIGTLLAIMYEIKSEGIEKILYEYKKLIK